MSVIAIIDDHQLLLDSLKDIVLANDQVGNVAVYSSAKEFLEQPQNEKYDLVITDVDMPEMTGTELVARIRDIDKTQKIIVLSMHKDAVLIQNLFQLKVNSFLSKNSSMGLLNEAIDAVLSSGTFIPKSIEKLLDSNSQEKNYSLTKREIQIVQLISKGESNKDIADQCFISEMTVKTHRKNIMLKLGLRNTAELVRFAIENKLA